MFDANDMRMNDSHVNREFNNVRGIVQFLRGNGLTPIHR